MDKIFKSLADKHRRMILTLLMKQSLTVGEIKNNLDIGQATVSNHLSILKKANLISDDVKGKFRIYKINYETLAGFVKELNKFVGGISNEIIVRRKNSQ